MNRREFMKLAAVSATAMSLGLQFGCNGGGDESLDFAVLSDAHLYDPSLGTTGSAFESKLAHDGKLLRESEAILQSAVDSIVNSNAEFVIMPGDMTKDGERASHELMASHLARIKDAGKMVYVVPGNHDVLNPGAYSYSGSTQTRVPNVTPEEFVSLYAEYGYNAAIARDPDSLSYVAEPAPGYWILGMDSCVYNSANTTMVTGGEFSASTLAWIRARLAEARQNNTIVLGIAHHALTEHFTGQSTFFPDFVIRNWQTVSQTLAQDGLRFVFTGHFHGTDVTQRSWANPDAQLFDTVTSSLVSAPCAFRQVSIENDVMNISTHRITSIDYDTGAMAFQDYARDYTYTKLLVIYGSVLTNSPYSMTPAQAQQYAPFCANAYLAHCAGDESPDATTTATFQALLASPDPGSALLGQYISTLWTDLPPSDNFLSVSISRS